MKLIAHRGVSSLAPENTMAAFVKCLDVGVSWFEFDVQMIADGSLVVIHDDTLDRTTDASGPVQKRNISELKRVDAGAWFGPTFRFERIPELSTVVDLLNETPLCANLEVKPIFSDEEREGVVEAVAHIARKVKNQEKLLISSFDHFALEGLKEFNTAYLVDKRRLRADFAGLVDKAVELGCSAIHPEVGGFDSAGVQAMHDRGLEVNVWTVNELEEAEKLQNWGVDGIITDKPQDLVAIVSAN